MLFRRQNAKYRVLQYSSLCREINIVKLSRLTAQQIELQSYKITAEECPDNEWSVYFRPKLHEIATTTAISLYKPTKSVISHTASRAKIMTANQAHHGGEILVGVVTMPKNGLEQIYEFLGSKITHLCEAARELQSSVKGLLHTSVKRACRILVLVSNSPKFLLSLSNLCRRQLVRLTGKGGLLLKNLQIYLSENLVLTLLIVFIIIVGIFTVLQTIVFFINLVRI